MSTYIKGVTAGPADGFTWTDNANQVRDFSTGWTFEVRIVTDEDRAAALHTKTSGITGSATAPNLVIEWALTDWEDLEPGTYRLIIIATPSGGKPMSFDPGNPPELVLEPEPAT